MDKRSKTIYVAGPMRGYDNWNYDAFNRQAEALQNQGWTVINPAELDKTYADGKWSGPNGVLESDPHRFNPNLDYNHQEFLREVLLRDLSHICTDCGAIYMMRGWENSKGAKAEWALGKALGLRIYYEVPLPEESHEN
jgi:hypothetical protein